MRIAFIARLRWARWLSFLAAVSPLAYWLYWPLGSDRETTSSRSRIDAADGEELVPSLVEAQELATANHSDTYSHSLALPPAPGWDPLPDWRHELSGSLGEHARQAAKDSLPTSMVQENFPLEPRFKKGPPIIGSRLGEFGGDDEPRLFQPIAQPPRSIPTSSPPPPSSPPTAASPTASPFATLQPPSLGGSSPPSANSRQPAWPDQGFTPTPPISAGNFLETDPRSPHRLTTARRDEGDPSSSALVPPPPDERVLFEPPTKRLTPSPSQPDPHASPSPPPRYILQPIKD